MNFDKPIRRLAPSIEIEPIAVDTDTFRYIFSNEKRGRDGFVVLNKGIRHANYDLNPVVLFAHDDTQPVVGRGLNIDTSKADCTLDVTFVPREILPFAGVIRDLVAGKWMRAISLSWLPVTYKRSSDPDIEAIFTAVDMLECSIVPLPALPDALLAARSSGVNLRPLAEWAERGLATPTYRAVPRDRLEAIYRAAALPAPSSSSSTRAERLAKANELIERGKRLEIVSRLQAGETLNRKENDDVSENLREARGHMQRALRRHKELAGHHGDLGEQAGNLRDIHRALTSTLGELGIEDKGVARAMKDLDRCGRAIRTAHTGAEDSADAAASHVDKAADCLTAIGEASK